MLKPKSGVSQRISMATVASTFSSPLVRVDCSYAEYAAVVRVEQELGLAFTASQA